jgi:hypothetical protein
VGARIKPTQTLTLPRDVKGWRGGSTAEIELADLGARWIWNTGFQLMSGDHWGSCRPLWDDERHSAPTRAAAIQAASDDFRTLLGDRIESYPDARRIMAWLDQLQPDRLDLFAA